MCKSGEHLMKITLSQSQFLKHIQMVERAVNDRSTLPILSNVLLQTEGDKLVLTATDLDVGIQCRFPIEGSSSDGAVTLPAKRLATIIRELPNSEVTLEAKKNHTATLNCGTSSFRIPGLPADDFPSLPIQENVKGIELSEKQLKTLITRTAYAMSMEETRFVLNGALLKAVGNQLTLVATDGRRLAVASSTLDTEVGQPLDVIIPAKTIRELGRLLKDSEEDRVAIITLEDHQVMFRFSGVTMMTRLIEGQFPNYERVIPPKSEDKLVCARGVLVNAVRRASLMTTATSQAVVFELTPNQLVVFKESPEVGSAREELEVEYSGEAVTIAFNPDFWLEAFKVINDEQVVIEFSGADKPAVIRKPEFVYIVLPMKIN